MVIQGSNNVELNVYVVEKGALVPLDGSTVTLTIKAGGREVDKPANITGLGLVSTLLSSSDLSSSGVYYIQAVVSYTDGRLFLSEEGSFIVGPKL